LDFKSYSAESLKDSNDNDEAIIDDIIDSPVALEIPIAEFLIKTHYSQFPSEIIDFCKGYLFDTLWSSLNEKCYLFEIQVNNDVSLYNSNGQDNLIKPINANNPVIETTKEDTTKLVGFHIENCSKYEEQCLLRWKHVLEEEGMDMYSKEVHKEIFIGFYDKQQGLALMKFNDNKFSFEMCDLFTNEKRAFARRRTKT